MKALSDSSNNESIDIGLSASKASLLRQFVSEYGSDSSGDEEEKKDGKMAAKRISSRASVVSLGLTSIIEAETNDEDETQKKFEQSLSVSQVMAMPDLPGASMHSASSHKRRGRKKKKDDKEARPMGEKKESKRSMGEKKESKRSMGEKIESSRKLSKRDSARSMDLDGTGSSHEAPPPTEERAAPISNDSSVGLSESKMALMMEMAKEYGSDSSSAMISGNSSTWNKSAVPLGGNKSVAFSGENVIKEEAAEEDDKEEEGDDQQNEAEGTQSIKSTNDKLPPPESANASAASISNDSSVGLSESKVALMMEYVNEYGSDSSSTMVSGNSSTWNKSGLSLAAQNKSAMFGNENVIEEEVTEDATEGDADDDIEEEIIEEEVIEDQSAAESKDMSVDDKSTDDSEDISPDDQSPEESKDKSPGDQSLGESGDVSSDDQSSEASNAMSKDSMDAQTIEEIIGSDDDDDEVFEEEIEESEYEEESMSESMASKSFSVDILNQSKGSVRSSNGANDGDNDAGVGTGKQNQNEDDAAKSLQEGQVSGTKTPPSKKEKLLTVSSQSTDPPWLKGCGSTESKMNSSKSAAEKGTVASLKSTEDNIDSTKPDKETVSSSVTPPWLKERKKATTPSWLKGGKNDESDKPSNAKPAWMANLKLKNANTSNSSTVKSSENDEVDNRPAWMKKRESLKSTKTSVEVQNISLNEDENPGTAEGPAQSATTLTTETGARKVLGDYLSDSKIKSSTHSKMSMEESEAGWSSVYSSTSHDEESNESSQLWNTSAGSLNGAGTTTTKVVQTDSSKPPIVLKTTLVSSSDGGAIMETENQMTAEGEGIEESHIEAEGPSEDEEMKTEHDALVAEEKRLSDEIAAQEKRIADQKAAEEAQIAAEEKVAKEKQNIEEKAAEEARLKAEEEARIVEEARLKAEEEARIAEDVRLKAEEETRVAEEMAAEDARLKAAEESRVAEEKAVEDARLKAEEEARVSEDARQKAKDEARIAEEKLAEEARLKAEEEARVAEEKAAEDARLKAEEEARISEDVRQKAEDEARIAEEKLAEESRHKAEEEARVAEEKATEDARLEAEEEARVAGDMAAEDARQKAAEESRMAEEDARLKAEEQASVEEEMAAEDAGQEAEEDARIVEEKVVEDASPEHSKDDEAKNAEENSDLQKRATPTVVLSNREEPTNTGEMAEADTSEELFSSADEEVILSEETAKPIAEKDTSIFEGLNAEKSLDKSTSANEAIAVASDDDSVLLPNSDGAATTAGEKPRDGRSHSDEEVEQEHAKKDQCNERVDEGEYMDSEERRDLKVPEEELVTREKYQEAFHAWEHKVTEKVPSEASFMMSPQRMLKSSDSWIKRAPYSELQMLGPPVDTMSKLDKIDPFGGKTVPGEEVGNGVERSARSNPMGYKQALPPSQSTAVIANHAGIASSLPQRKMFATQDRNSIDDGILSAHKYMHTEELQTVSEEKSLVPDWDDASCSDESWLPPSMMDEDTMKSISYKKKSFEAVNRVSAFSDAQNGLTTQRSVRIDFTGAITSTTSQGSFRWLPPDMLDASSLDNIVSQLPPADSPESSTEIDGDSPDLIGMSDIFDASGLIAQSGSARFDTPESNHMKFDPDLLPNELLTEELPMEDEPSEEDLNPDFAPTYDGVRFKSVSFGTDEVIPDSNFIQTEDNDVERGRISKSLRTTNKSSWSICKCFFACLLLLVPVAAGLIIYFLLIARRDSTGNPADTDLETPSLSPIQPPAISPSQPVIPPESPTTQSTIPESDVLLQLLSRYAADDGKSLRDPSSPQFAAMKWIRTPNNAGIYSDRRFLTRYALASLYFSTRGAEWTTSSGWLTPAHECDWFSGRPNSPSCDDEGNIVEIDLTENNLQGTLPPELTLLGLSK